MKRTTIGEVKRVMVAALAPFKGKKYAGFHAFHDLHEDVKKALNEALAEYGLNYRTWGVYSNSDDRGEIFQANLKDFVDDKRATYNRAGKFGSMSFEFCPEAQKVRKYPDSTPFDKALLLVEYDKLAKRIQEHTDSIIKAKKDIEEYEKWIVEAREEQEKIQNELRSIKKEA